MTNPYSMTDQDLALVDEIFNVALTGTDAELAARRDITWTVAIVLLSDALLRSSQEEREKLLLALPLELKRALRDIPRTAKGQLQ
jgi:hypothetical protein